MFRVRKISRTMPCLSTSKTVARASGNACRILPAMLQQLHESYSVIDRAGRHYANMPHISVPGLVAMRIVRTVGIDARSSKSDQVGADTWFQACPHAVGLIARRVRPSRTR